MMVTYESIRWLPDTCQIAPKDMKMLKHWVQLCESVRVDTLGLDVVLCAVLMWHTKQNPLINDKWHLALSVNVKHPRSAHGAIYA